MVIERELITASSNIRKKFKDLMMTKRNSIEETEAVKKLITMYSYELRSGSLVEEEHEIEKVVLHNLPLRVISI